MRRQQDLTDLDVTVLILQTSLVALGDEGAKTQVRFAKNYLAIAQRTQEPVHYG